MHAKVNLGDRVRQLGPGLAVLVLGLGLTLLSDNFLTVSNLLNVLRQVSINAIIACGMTMVILTAGIDLSVGSVLALGSAITAGLSAGGTNPLLAILAGLGVGALVGFVNGAMVTKGAVPAFVATLGTMAIARGLTLVYTGGRPITGLPSAIQFIGTGYLGPIPVPIVIMAIVAVLVYIFLRHTPYGRYLYAVGSNPEAARFAGIPVNRVLRIAYVLTGILSVLAGMILIGRLNSAQPTAGQSFEMDAIAAVVLGGTSLAGGQGGVAGTLVGALIIGILENGLNLLKVPSFWQQVAKGAVILGAVLLDRRRK